MPDPRMKKLCADVGVSMRGIRSKSANAEILQGAGEIWAMDYSNLAALSEIVDGTSPTPQLFDPAGEEIADPFFDSTAAVRQVFEQLVKISEQRVREIAHRMQEDSRIR